MRKFVVFFVITLFLFLPKVSALSASYVKCIDGDTAMLKFNGKAQKVRFLAVDAPEIKHGSKKADPYADDAKLFTCIGLQTARKIEVEFDSNSNKTDKYGRSLVWVFVDGELLQAKLVKKGLAKVAYLYGDYKYTNDLKKYEASAKKKKLNIWSDYKFDYSKYVIIAIILFLVLVFCYFDKSFRKKTIRKIKNKAKKDLSKEFDKLLK